jgi:hypothetical protein
LATEVIRDYDLHPPDDEVRLFPMPTPGVLRLDDRRFVAVDLFLDVLVRSDGVTRGVHDQQALDDALPRGWVSEREAAGAREGLAELLELIQADRLVAFLAEAHPFAPVDAPAAPAMQSVPLRQVPLLQPGVRPSW